MRIRNDSQTGVGTLGANPISATKFMNKPYWGGQFMSNQTPDEFFLCIEVLLHKAWGKTLVGNRLRSKSWWENRKEELINHPPIDIPPEKNIVPGTFNADGTPETPPIPFETEMGWTEDTTEYWLKNLQIVYRKRYEHQGIAQKMAERIQRSRDAS